MDIVRGVILRSLIVSASAKRESSRSPKRCTLLADKLGNVLDRETYRRRYRVFLGHRSLY